MKKNDKVQYIDDEYKKLSESKHIQNAQILFNILKFKHAELDDDTTQSLYLDVKKFLQEYIVASDDLDYGYDEINFSKIRDALSVLDLNQRRSLLMMTKRMFYTRGYDQSEIDSELVVLDRDIAWKNSDYFTWLMNIIGSCWWCVIMAYTIYAIILFAVLHPAPYDWMCCFYVELQDYCNNPQINYFLNTLAWMTGVSDIAPVVKPNGFWGVIIYCTGLLAFYFIIANYVFKRVQNYIDNK